MDQEVHEEWKEADIEGNETVSDIIYEDDRYLISKSDLIWIKRDHFNRPFRQGYQDKLDDLPYRDEYDHMNCLAQIDYESGRQFAIFYQGDLSSQEAAITFYKFAFDRKSS